jgi:hypothetical protein
VHSAAAGIFYQPWQQLCCGAKTPFPKPNRHTFGFSSSNFTVQDHILSTAGDALTLDLYHITNFKEREREKESSQIVWNLQAKCYERTKNPKLPFGSFYNTKKETPLHHTSSLPQFIYLFIYLCFEFLNF